MELAFNNYSLSDFTCGNKLKKDRFLKFRAPLDARR